MTDREAFEAEYIKLQPDTVKLWPDKLGLNASGEYADVSVNIHWKFWQAAIAHERERCAKKCNAISEDKWALYKGRPPYTGKEPGRFSDFVQGQSDGADQCADAIRKGDAT